MASLHENDLDDRYRMVSEALAIYREAEGYDQEQRERAIKLLAGHGLWSLQHIAKIVRTRVNLVRLVVTKQDRTGGRFNPDTLDYILEEINLAKLGDSNPLLTAKIWDMGTTPSFVARLTGLPSSTMQWRATKGREERASE